jgi:hypothetical protein
VAAELDRFFDTAFKVTLNKDFVCHYVFPVCEKKVYEAISFEAYRERVLRDKPQELAGDDFINKVYQEIEQDGDEVPKTYNIVQITDWHVDLNYKEGSNRNCAWEMCCQEEYGMPEVEEDKARKYGELTCDIPYITAVKQMQALV